MVVVANSVANPGAMVIEARHTLVYTQRRRVFRPQRPHSAAGVAQTSATSLTPLLHRDQMSQQLECDLFPDTQDWFDMIAREIRTVVPVLHLQWHRQSAAAIATMKAMTVSRQQVDTTLLTAG